MDDLERGMMSGKILVCYADIASMEARQQESVCELVAQLRRTDDPDALGTFVRWRQDETLEILMMLAAKLSEPELDDLVGEAEKVLENREGATLRLVKGGSRDAF